MSSKYWPRRCLRTIVLLDNLASHMGGLKEAIATQGTKPLYLPPCGPDLNPIEQAICEV
jgi:transposase